jgi:hypothetical protein
MLSYTAVAADEEEAVGEAAVVDEQVAVVARE